MADTPIETFERELGRKLGKPVPARKPGEVSFVWDTQGLEVALARDPIPARSLVRVWRDRQAGRGRPLLLVAPSDGDGERIAVVGPSEGQPRTAEPSALAIEIARLSHETPQRAARAVEQALAGLSDQALPGVIVRDLLTIHYVRTRLPQQRVEERERLAATAAPVRGKVDWRDALPAFGYDVRQRSRGGWEVRLGARAIALVHPKPHPSEFSRIDESGRLPEGTLVAACRRDGVRWGLMVADSRIRLFDAQAERGAATDHWLDLDLAALPADHWYLIGLLAPAALEEGGVWQTLIADARDFGAALKDRLDEQIRRFALPGIAQGLGEWLATAEREDLADPGVRHEIQQATYTFLFRLLFILYAESAGYLPYGRSASYERNALKTLCAEARERRDRLDPHSRTFWLRLQTLTKAIRNGDKGMDLPEYNGSLFDPEGLPGAGLLDRAEVSDAYIAPALEAVGFDFEGDDVGLDYANLEIGHLGSIYEGLLALRLSLADQTYRFDPKAANKQGRYIPAEEPGEDGVGKGRLFFQTEAGGRKGGGVYYTRPELVRHLVNHSVVPALQEHLEQVKKRVANDPAAAERLLFRFRVLDPAMGSGHFLVDALNVIADEVQRFLAETPLPPLKARLDALRAEAGAESAEDAELLKRLLLKHCIYGVDLSEMAVELARVALWLASFVPGLALSYLDQNLKRGDSLVGLASFDLLAPPTKDGKARAGEMWTAASGPLAKALREASALAWEIADLPDRTKEEFEQSRAIRTRLDAQLEGVRRACDLWAAEPFGVKGARAALLQGQEILSGQMSSDVAELARQAQQEACKRSFFHWPLEFPEVFHRSSERNPGFDAVIGNPPWDNFLVDELSFYALHKPGIRGLSNEAERRSAVSDLLQDHPELREEFATLRSIIGKQRRFFRAENGYPIQGGGHLDLYELFCERYGILTRDGGHLGVVLPRVAFLGYGSRGFRRWLFRECTPTRLDILLNNKSWAFPIHPQWTLVLLGAQVGHRTKGEVLVSTGPSRNEERFKEAVRGDGVPLPLDDLANWTPPSPDDSSDEPSWEVPLVPTRDAAHILGQIRRGPRFDRWAEDHGRVFLIQGDMNETSQKALFKQKSGTAVWKGSSFNQYEPHGRKLAGHGNWGKILQFVQKRRTSKRSNFVSRFPGADLNDPSTHPIHRARVAFRDAARATDSRTTIACLIPPGVGLTHKAPYLVFPSGNGEEEAYVLGLLNSLPFDWQARRYVENSVAFFLLALLCFPPDERVDRDGITTRASRLSCVDDRFRGFAKTVGVKCGPLRPEERDVLRSEIDVLVARAYGLDAAELEVIFQDFTLDAVPDAYRELVRDKFAEFEKAPAK